MRYVLLIHSNPRPWGHPTADFLPEFQALPEAQRRASMAAFDTLLTELQEAGELVGGEALGDPATARLFRSDGTAPSVSDGPYGETKEHFAGFFLIDVASQERAEQIAARMSGPGETVELRPVMSGGADD